MGLKLSVIIPMYNEESILPATLQTLHTYMQANFDDYEILFSDDGSTDRSGDIADRLAERDIRIEDEFGISDSAVKKQARSYKSVIKLDRNFHIYVHGNRNLLEQGEDEKGKFYKVYYQEEE